VTHVSLPNIPDAVPPLQAVHGCNVAPHFEQFIATILLYAFNLSGPFSSMPTEFESVNRPCHDHPTDTGQLGALDELGECLVEGANRLRTDPEDRLAAWACLEEAEAIFRVTKLGRATGASASGGSLQLSFGGVAPVLEYGQD